MLGLVREQGWLADRALEVVLRREKRLYSVERRAAAEAVYGVLRAQGRIEWLLGHRAAIAELYAAALAAPGGLPQDQAERRLGLSRGALAPLAGAEAVRIRGIEDPGQRLGVEGSLPPWLAERLVAEMGLDEARAFSAAVNVRAPLTVRANPIVVIDFGSQYSMLIARRVREFNVYCDLVSYDTKWDEVSKLQPMSFILSGGPSSVYDEGAPLAPYWVYESHLPILGICYGMQVLCQQLGGKVTPGLKREYGHAILHLSTVDNPLFADLPQEILVWMIKFLIK